MMEGMTEETAKFFAKILLDPMFEDDPFYQALTVVEETKDIFRNEYDGD